MRALSLLSIAVFAAASARAESFTCPVQVETDATAGGTPQSFKFRYVSFYDGDPAEMADLAPDDGPDPKKLHQRWQFARTPGRPIVMVCRYHGTQATVRKDVPASIKECRIEGELDGKGEIVGSPKLTCK
jgi:hypothetical protein